MAFCGKCGTKYEDGAKFCPSCGAVVSAASNQPMQQAAPRQSTPVYTTPVVPGTQGQADIRDAQDNKVMAILAYFGPLVLIPIFAAKESRFARYHANQGRGDQTEDGADNRGCVRTLAGKQHEMKKGDHTRHEGDGKEVDRPIQNACKRFYSGICVPYLYENNFSSRNDQVGNRNDEEQMCQKGENCK